MRIHFLNNLTLSCYFSQSSQKREIVKTRDQPNSTSPRTNHHQHSKSTKFYKPRNQKAKEIKQHLETQKKNFMAWSLMKAKFTDANISLHNIEREERNKRMKLV